MYSYDRRAAMIAPPTQDQAKGFARDILTAWAARARGKNPRMDWDMFSGEAQLYLSRSLSGDPTHNVQLRYNKKRAKWDCQIHTMTPGGWIFTKDFSVPASMDAREVADIIVRFTRHWVEE